MYRKILVPLDGSKLAECVLPHVVNLVKERRAREIVLVQVVEPISIPYGRKISEVTSVEQLEAFAIRKRREAEEYLKKIENRLTRSGIRAKSIVASGKAAEVIVDLVDREKVDLVMIATHGRSGVSRLVWGSVADRIIRSVRVPLLVIRAPGHNFRES